MDFEPRYYFSIRDMLGNVYSQEGRGLKLVPYTRDISGDYIKGDPATSGIILTDDVDRDFFVIDTEFSGLYDLYLHTSDSGYELLRENIWIVGKDLDASMLEKRAFRVGSGDKAIFAQSYDQVIFFNVRNSSL